MRIGRVVFKRTKLMQCGNRFYIDRLIKFLTEVKLIRQSDTFKIQ
jgi:hypothetical protein